MTRDKEDAGMIFMDNRHREFYEDCISRTNAASDPYRKALFYTLGLTDETRRNINHLYDFEERGINFDGLFGGFQTSGSLKVTRMAFNLYNGFTGDTGGQKSDAPDFYSPYHLYDTGLMAYFFEAVKLRYPEYYQAPTNIAPEREGGGSPGRSCKAKDREAR